MHIVFRAADGKETRADCKPGMSVLQVAQSAGIDLEGACEGNMACSTCHIYLSADYFGAFPEPAIEEVEMLELTVGVRRFSRLGCQLFLENMHNGLIIDLPQQHQNMLGL